MNYVDGFVAAVANENKSAYLAHAKVAAQIFKEYGAINCVECWGEDVPTGEKTSFPQAVMCREDETVVLAWIIWPSKAARDAGMEKVMQDERMQAEELPFDGTRMIFGGFQMILDS